MKRSLCYPICAKKRRKKNENIKKLLKTYIYIQNEQEEPFLFFSTFNITFTIITLLLILIVIKNLIFQFVRIFFVMLLLLLLLYYIIYRTLNFRNFYYYSCNLLLFCVYKQVYNIIIATITISSPNIYIDIANEFICSFVISSEERILNLLLYSVKFNDLLICIYNILWCFIKTEFFFFLFIYSINIVFKFYSNLFLFKKKKISIDKHNSLLFIYIYIISPRPLFYFILFYALIFSIL